MNPVMLYKYPGTHKIDGEHFTYCIVEEDEKDKALKDGWFSTPAAALEASKEPEPKKTKAKKAADKKGG